MTSAESTFLPAPEPVAAGDAAVSTPARPRRRLFRKYALLFIALVGAALLVTSGFDFWFSYQENKAALIRIQQEKAEAAAQRIGEFIGEIERQIGWTTHAQWAAGPLDQRRPRLGDCRFSHYRLLPRLGDTMKHGLRTMEGTPCSYGVPQMR